MNRFVRAGLGATSIVCGFAATAQSVTMNGSLGTQKALLVIDGQPYAVTVGSTVKGVRLLSLSGNQVEVEVGGARRTVLLSAGPVRMAGGGGSGGGGKEIVLTAGSDGHFQTLGQINGKSVTFLVDTGASMVGISQAEADRLGIDYKSSQRRGFAETANGRVPAYAVTLNSVRVGDVEVANVDAMIVPASMPHILLGNSFLMRFQMKRENDTMRLEKRPN
ncbi:MAG: TIGR02281 family clan AA aspartic protease [Aquincola sp.]|nr:TIGR02281 family clan AA aspartic protease [Aquincola sp.]